MCLALFVTFRLHADVCLCSRKEGRKATFPPLPRTSLPMFRCPGRLLKYDSRRTGGVQRNLPGESRASVGQARQVAQCAQKSPCSPRSCSSTWPSLRKRPIPTNAPCLRAAVAPLSSSPRSRFRDTMRVCERREVCSHANYTCALPPQIGSRKRCLLTTRMRYLETNTYRIR